MVFVAWEYAAKNGTLVRRIPGEKITTVYSNLTVKAIWEKAYTVTLDAGEGEGKPVDRKVAMDSFYTLPSYMICDFREPEGKSFI